MKYIVYCTTCTVNGKIYIGVHKTEDPNVFDGYIGNGIEIGWSIKNPKTAYQHALKKYGYSKFKRATLFIFDNEDDAYLKEAEIVNFEFIKRRDNYNTALGGRHPGNTYKTLYQYDLDGNFVLEWFSVKDTSKHFHCNSNRFNICILEKRSAFNSFWSLEKVEKLDISDYKKSFHDTITYQYDLEGNFIKEFDSIKDIISEFPLFNRNNIAEARSLKCPIGGFYFVEPSVEIIDVIKTRELVLNLTDKSVSKYKDGIRIKTYKTLSSAAKAEKISSNAIKKSIKNKEGVWNYGYSDIYAPQVDPVLVKVKQTTVDGVLVKIWDSIAQCLKEFPKARLVIRGERGLTHGYIFSLIS